MLEVVKLSMGDFVLLAVSFFSIKIFFLSVCGNCEAVGFQEVFYSFWWLFGTAYILLPL